MARSTRPVSRIDGVLRSLQTRGMRRGVRGDTRPWFWVFVVVWVTRRLRRATGGEPAVVYRGELEPGATLEIRHLTETHGGKSVRRR
jgi:hypothetical protein